MTAMASKLWGIIWCFTSATAYVVRTQYSTPDCSGTPTKVMGITTEVQAMGFGAGGCYNLPQGRRQRVGDNTKSVIFRVGEDGNCFLDAFTDEECQEGKQTKQMWDGTCEGRDPGSNQPAPDQHSDRHRGGGGGEMAGGPPEGGQAGRGSKSVQTLCTNELPEQLDWNATCLTLTKANEHWKLLKEMKQGKKVCYSPCMDDTEQTWQSSKLNFDAAFEKGGCADSCTADMKELAFLGGVQMRKFDCNFKAGIQRVTRAVTV
mmetsp:Transcript_27781/g.50746  ORF Transcript_27781/g.50746 Transcript_27781/m.50746 type:complete len:261 (-) Transcript_27781:150-932(-)